MSSTTKNKYTWYAGPYIYEYDESVMTPTLNISEVKIPTGVLRANATNLNSAYTVYQITDHLGNVRATFKGTGTNSGIDILSFNDYYAFGGELPGRKYINESYRYGYQDQEKPDASNSWYSFDLRMYNQDIGRWFAPDPMGQFASPYIGMANNPVSLKDPDGGWVDAAPGAGVRWLGKEQMEYERETSTGAYSYQASEARYEDQYQNLREHFLGGDYERGNDVPGYLKAVTELNNLYYGLCQLSSQNFTAKTGIEYLTTTEMGQNTAQEIAAGQAIHLSFAQMENRTMGEREMAEQSNAFMTFNHDAGQRVWTPGNDDAQTSPAAITTDGDKSEGQANTKTDEVEDSGTNKSSSNAGNEDKTSPGDETGHGPSANEGGVRSLEISQELRTDWLKQYIAVIVGESSNSHDEAEAMGEVIQNRMAAVGSEFGEGFFDDIGGAGEFKAIGGKIYNSIMSSSWEDILSGNNPYNTRISGAIHAFISPEDDVSNGAYFWNKSTPETGFNWRMEQNGTYTTTTTLGSTTYFRYTDTNKSWP